MKAASPPLLSGALRPVFTAPMMGVLLGLAIATGLLTGVARAERHGACMRCGQFVRISETGAGFVRDWVGLCGTCRLSDERGKLLEGFDAASRENEPPSETMKRLGIEVGQVNGIRYLHFQDGTLIDLKHFMAASDVALTLGEVCTNILGWMKEIDQWMGDEPSGHPLGGNEDLRSNLDGADFGDEHLSDDSGVPLGEQILDYLEAEHGPATRYEYEKKTDARQDGVDTDDDLED